MRRQVLVLCTSFLAGACDILDPTYDEPAIIIPAVVVDLPPNVDAPDSAARGEAFTVTVRTFGGGCIRKIARTLVFLRDQLALISPYNETRRATFCNSDLLYLEHRVALAFDRPGVATIRVIGERLYVGPSRREPAQLERQVLIY